MLSRIAEPTTGWADVTGRVGSLLEVGTGFHPELTGRENVFLNGAILGMRRTEIRKRFDEIVEFADIERFLDTPVKRYSSGMSGAARLRRRRPPRAGDPARRRGARGRRRRLPAQVAGEDERGRAGRQHRHLRLPQPGHRSRRSASAAILLERGAVVTDAPVEEAVDRLPAGARARRQRRPPDSHRPRRPRLGRIEGQPPCRLRRRQRRGRRGRRRPRRQDRRRGDRGAADDGVPADDPQQPRPPDHHARQRAQQPRRRRATASSGRGSSARSTRCR